MIKQILFSLVLTDMLLKGPYSVLGHTVSLVLIRNIKK